MLLDRLEYHPRGFAELQIRRVEQALLLLFVEQALGRHQLENVDAGEIPSVRVGAFAQLFLGLRQGYVERLFPGLGSGHKERQRNGRLAGAWVTLKKEQAVADQAAAQNVVQAV